MWANLNSKSRVSVGILVGGLVITGLLTGIVTAQAISVDGEFSGELVGYGPDQSEQSHEIAIQGEFTFSGENAQNVVVTIEPGDSTVLKPTSVEIFVTGDREIAFDQSYRPNQIRLLADEVPSGTTVILEFESVFIGGTTAEEITASTVAVEYVSPGGTEGSASFDAQAATTDTADNRIQRLQEQLEDNEQSSLLWRLMSWVGIGGILLLIVAGGVKAAGAGGGDAPPGPP